MSLWREIWQKSVTANRVMSNNEEDGLIEFHYLFEDYGDDGMLHYACGEAWEYRKNFAKALEEYNKAKDYFPVPHWKDVAQNTINRLLQNKTAENYFDKRNFEDLLWFSFQKIYEYINLDDFVRYVCLSAISRANSEWPLSLVDFRTVLELQIKKLFPEIVEFVKRENNEFSLRDAINELKNQGYISSDICSSMHDIRKAGNIAVHELSFVADEDINNILNFIAVLEYFNNCKKNTERHR